MSAVATTQRARQRSGALGERIVEQQAAACARAGIGFLRKRPTSVVVVGGERRHVATAGCDYQGVLRGGRAVVVEVKRVSSGARLAHSALRPSQIEELELAHYYGAAVLLAVVWGPGATRLSALPWREVRTRVTASAPGSLELATWELRGRLLLEVAA